MFEAGLGSVSAAYASATGLSLSAAASVAGAIGVGSFLCQYPAGAAADRFKASSVFTGAALLLLAASLAFAFADRAPWLFWAVGLVWGGVGGALYTLAMVRVAHEFAGRATAGGAAAMITGYTLGGTVGPLASGSALQWGGVTGLAAVLGSLALATLLAARPCRPHSIGLGPVPSARLWNASGLLFPPPRARALPARERGLAALASASTSALFRYSSMSFW